MGRPRLIHPYGLTLTLTLLQAMGKSTSIPLESNYSRHPAWGGRSVKKKKKPAADFVLASGVACLRKRATVLHAAVLPAPNEQRTNSMPSSGVPKE